jgi:hypothetical protein
MNHKDKIRAYLARYSSKSEPKSIEEIAQTLSINTEDVGLIIHELLSSQELGFAKSPDKYNFLYYLLKNQND